MNDLRKAMIAQESYQTTSGLHDGPAAIGEPAVGPWPVHRWKERDRPVIRSLDGAVEADIVPRLVLARRASVQAGAAADEPRPPVVPSSSPPNADDVEAFALVALQPDDAVAFAFVDRMRARGNSLETLFLDLFGPAARHLGELWREDLRDFGTVTLGLCRLHQVLRDLSPVFQAEQAHHDTGLHALLVPQMGDQHSFGLLMVSEFFHRAGWHVRSGPIESPRHLAGIVRDEWFSVVGFSVSSDERLEALAAGIRMVRRESRNRAVGVMVGGRVFVEHPDLVARVGADAMAVDARQAVQQAHDLVAVIASGR